MFSAYDTSLTFQSQLSHGKCINANILSEHSIAYRSEEAFLTVSHKLPLNGKNLWQEGTKESCHCTICNPRLLHLNKENKTKIKLSMKNRSVPVPQLVKQGLVLGTVSESHCFKLQGKFCGTSTRKVICFVTGTSWHAENIQNKLYPRIPVWHFITRCFPAEAMNPEDWMSLLFS